MTFEADCSVSGGARESRMPKTGALAGFEPWTPAEDAKLVEAYSRGGIYAALEALPRRSKAALFHRAERLRARLPGLIRRARWTPKDDAELQDLWGTASLANIAKRLSRTPATTYVRAQILKLPLGCPQGHEYVRNAADRTGFSSGELRRILKAAGVKVWLSMARPNAGKFRFHTVDPFDVDEAVAAWMKTEVVHCAAEARGMAGETLREWLVSARARGVEMPAPPKLKKARWRVPTSVIDSVIEWQAARESLSAAAVRTGIGRSQLRRWIVEAGIPIGRAKPWLLEKSAVDALVAERAAFRREQQEALS